MSEHIIQSFLLPRLQCVKKAPTGPRTTAQWRALCPACQQDSKSKDQKLSIALSTTGAVLVHCHRCGSGLPALAALGIDYSDLRPKLLPEGRQHAGRGNGGPGRWLSHAAQVDGLIDAHTRLLALVAPALPQEVREQALDLLIEVGELAQGVKESARAAYRAAAERGAK